MPLRKGVSSSHLPAVWTNEMKLLLSNFLILLSAKTFIPMNKL